MLAGITPFREVARGYLGTHLHDLRGPPWRGGQGGTGLNGSSSDGPPPSMTPTNVRGKHNSARTQFIETDKGLSHPE